jgi:hypothetical protein
MTNQRINKEENVKSIYLMIQEELVRLTMEEELEECVPVGSKPLIVRNVVAIA